MTLEEVQARLESGISESIVTMQGDGCNCSAVIISPAFEGISKVNRQRLVLKLVKEEINKKDDNTLINQINHFADVVSKKIQPKVNGNDGLVSLKIFAAITKSAKLGKKIRL